MARPPQLSRPTAEEPSGLLRPGSSADELVHTLRTLGATSRAEIARALGVSRTRAGQLVGELARMGLVTEAPRPPEQDGPSAGRPGRPVRLRPGLGFAVGVNITHDDVRCLATDLSHTMVASASRPLGDPSDVEEATDLVAAVVREVIAEAGPRHGECLGIGVAVPAPVDPETGRPAPSSCLGLWVDAPVRELLQERLGLPVFLDNHGNLAVVAELLWGVGRLVDDFIWIGLDANVGGGICSGGRLVRGRDGLAGELGHVVVDPDGEVCRCGSQGCLETVASLASLQRALEPAHGRLDAAAIHRLIAQGDPAAVRAVTNLGTQVGIALTTLVNVLNPSIIVVGGFLGRPLGAVVLEAVGSEIARRALPTTRRSLDVRFSRLRRPEPLGAAALVLTDRTRSLRLDRHGRPFWTSAPVVRPGSGGSAMGP
ncbi:ROK family transcriptional regulator [Desertihabitans brevis]|uniref:ROK family transcriptional regulator n=1 Tax=Desertihabitans brevis TaxID=2268447 RepID=A0A367YYQ2_9ACTN|nr:ROK family transcriptional regulator [Desertihabitans brevis]RCK70081.1 ROK family transcriptional regulator [Desertihabitans brevis]